MNIEKVLEEKISLAADSRVKDAMIYSLMAGGKRIRPLLMYETVKGYGLNERIADPFASALEMIHTYSLIHDDLPCMDDDELRRGRPTCHIQFDESTAVLAGDGLLTFAFETAAASDADPAKVVKCIRILAEMAGPSGMVLGQVLDIREGESDVDWEALKEIHAKKTGCLLSAPFMIGAVLAGADAETVEKWHAIGTEIGLAFQIQDDILDVELTPEEFGKSASDADNNKVTSVTLLGIEESQKLMNELYDRSLSEIREMRGFDSCALEELINGIKTRRK